MLTVNLISKKRRTAKTKNWILWIVYGVLGSIFLFFLGQIGYTAISTLLLNRNLSIINKEQVALSNEILKNDQKLTQFVLSKLIIDKIRQVQSEQFRYKDYLDRVNTYIPTGATLQGVDFSEKGQIKVTVECVNSGVYREFENKLLDDNVVSADPFFGVFVIEQVSRNEEGKVSVKLLFGLKQPTNAT